MVERFELVGFSAVVLVVIAGLLSFSDDRRSRELVSPAQTSRP